MPKKAKTNHVPLTKVVLYKHGMGYFERFGKISGPTTIDLFCSPEAIDDMLKSLLILNLGGGRSGIVTYDSSKTTEMRFEEFGFDLRNCRGLVDLIGNLKGTPVKVTVSSQNIVARVLGLDEVEHVVGDKIVRENQLVLFTADGTIKRYSFSAITALHVEDEAIAGEIRQQLELLFDQTKKKDKKRLQIAVDGTTSRDLFVAYTIPAPIWKTSYRLVCVPDGSLLLQGMAIVDNVQDEDWTEVQMVLVSAAPISFIQPLYDPIQPPRRTIAPQGVISSGPVLAERAQHEEPGAPRMAGSQMRAKQIMPQAAAAPQSGSYGSSGAFAAPGQAGWAEESNLLQAMQDSFQGGSLPIEAAPSGELFEYKITRAVTVPRNSSALIPLVQQPVEGERISLYNARTNIKFPYASIRLKNTTGLTLESGPVTVMEEHAYAGEAMMDVLKPDDVRMLPYALDQGCHVIVRTDTNRKPVWRVRAAYGFIYMDYREQYKSTYKLENLSDRMKIVFVEHPVLPGMQLADGIKPTETSQSFHRFRVEVPAKKINTLDVLEETDASFHIRVDNVQTIDQRQLDWLVQQNYADKEFLVFLNRLVKDREGILELHENKKKLEGQIAQYKSDQERARENIKTLGTSSDRYRQAIDEAEDKIMKASKDLEALNQTITEKERKFVEMVRAELVSEINVAAARKR